MQNGIEEEDQNSLLGIKVLIADDDTATRLLLRAAISQWGYDVIEANDGEEAWRICRETDNPPRLLVLDWMMPKIDGITLSARIKKEFSYQTYIILLTQMTGTSNIVKALGAGADEFLTKPFNMAELYGRLLVGAKIIGYESILAEQNKELHKYAVEMGSMVDQRARELMHHTDFLMMLGAMVMRISTELTDLFVQICPPDLAENKEFSKIQQLQINLKQIIELIKQVQIESMSIEKTINPCQLNNIIHAAIGVCETDLKNIKVKYTLDSNLPEIMADESHLQKAVVGLCLNTIELLKKQPDGILEIETKYLQEKQAVQMTIECNGPAVLADNLSQVLQPLWGIQTKNDDKLNLSVAMCRDILQKYGGKLRIEPRSMGGLRFIVDLPLSKEEISYA